MFILSNDVTSVLEILVYRAKLGKDNFKRLCLIVRFYLDLIVRDKNSKLNDPNLLNFKNALEKLGALRTNTLHIWTNICCNVWL